MIQDLIILTLFVKSQAWRASATFSASTERGVYTLFWCQQPTTITTKYSCLCYFQVFFSNHTTKSLWDQRHLVHSCLWRLIAEQECEQESAHTWYNRGDDNRYNWYNRDVDNIFSEEVKIQTWYSWPAGQCTPAMKKRRGSLWWLWLIGALGEIASLLYLA